MSLACLLLGFLPVAVSPEAEGVDSRQVSRWIEACESQLDALHGFVLLRHGRLIAEGTWAPYDTLRSTHRLYSHSKSFTSTAIGFLVDDGKLDLDERVVDIFPDKIPGNPSDNLKALRVRDLLTMNVGADFTDAESRDADGDWERAFLANEIEHRPGQRFRYDSGATYMLSAIVGRRSGLPLMEFLQKRLFDPIGITSAWSTASPSGTPCGGWGMNMTTRDLALFGQLYLNRGVWNGVRILSEEWIALATARQTWSGPIGVTGEDGSDWHQGYGFQFWRCRNGCYRADGANGQYTIVMPEQDAVLSIHAGVHDMQKEIDLVWDFLLPAFGKGALPENKAAEEALRRRCVELSLPPVSGGRSGFEAFCGIECPVTNGADKVTAVRVDAGDGEGGLTIVTSAGRWSVPVGFGRWARGSVSFSDRRHEALGAIIGRQQVATSAGVAADGTLRIRMLLLDGPQKMDLVFRRDSGRVLAEGALRGIGGRTFAGRSVCESAKSADR